MGFKKIERELFECVCEKCGYIWETNWKPVACARCKQIGWNKKKKIKIQNSEEEII